jgi:hypothetical protein
VANWKVPAAWPFLQRPHAEGVDIFDVREHGLPPSGSWRPGPLPRGERGGSKRKAGLGAAAATARLGPLAARGAEPLRKFGGRRTEKTAYQATPIRQPRDRFKPVGLGQPQERQHSAAEGGTRDRLPPASGSIFCDRDGSRMAQTVPSAFTTARPRNGSPRSGTALSSPGMDVDYFGVGRLPRVFT